MALIASESWQCSPLSKRARREIANHQAASAARKLAHLVVYSGRTAWKRARFVAASIHLPPIDAASAVIVMLLIEARNAKISWRP